MLLRRLWGAFAALAIALLACLPASALAQTITCYGYYDSDGDGYGYGRIGWYDCAYVSTVGTDCNDKYATIYPGATEICDGLDNDCDSAIDEAKAWYTDGDGDGYGGGLAYLSCKSGMIANGTDCDDTDRTINPGATEVCNFVDDDCDRLVDEGYTNTWYLDYDKDGYGGETKLETCKTPSGYSSEGGDCDDKDPSINPAATEVCNLVDDDCDSTVDDGFTKKTYYRDADSDKFGNPSVTYDACMAPSGYVTNNTDCLDTDATINPGAAEICDGKDQNCNGGIDEGVKTTYYADADKDGFGDASSTTAECSLPSGYTTDDTDCDDGDASINPKAGEVCDGIDQDCDDVADDGLTTYTYYEDGDGDGYGTTSALSCYTSAPTGYAAKDGDCDDANKAVSPAALESCNEIDDDCDKLIDEGVTTAFYKDADADGYGVSTVTEDACSAPTGYAAKDGDCNDANKAVNPGATEVCNGADDDCSGVSDDGLPTYTYYVDGDGDGHGATTTATMCNATAPSGYSTKSDDCDDKVSTTYPGATETCNSVDDDCNGKIDDGVTTLYYADSDKDGYGDPSTSAVGCSAPTGYVANDDDCDDTRGTVNPKGVESCNDLDDDCDGTVDEGVKKTYYADSDGDLYGNASVSKLACSAPTGYVVDATDCVDTDKGVNPGAAEICNAKDDDCDSTIDEGVKTTYYRDSDNDGWGKSTSTQSACTAPTGYVAKSGDCDDTRNTVNPDGTEVCNSLDDNCDGKVDEGVTTTYYVDADGDGYGSTTTTQACSLPTGHATESTDCDDATDTTYPGANEACDGVDNDCDSAIDETAPVWYVDADGDGYGTTASTSSGCTAPSGYVGNSTDCDDTNDTVFPKAAETCNSVDDDCNGIVDDGVGTTYYADADTDGFGDIATVTKACSGAPTGYVSDYTDCDDTRDTVFPGATEVCNELDDDCDDLVDEDASDATTWYTDSDGDGYGLASTMTVACDAPDGMSVTADGDCDDVDASIHPAALESPDGVDQDCDGIVDEGTTLYDDDGDGYTEAGGDCDDTDVAISPAEVEICDSMDQDCDGTTDETTECYDDDGDGWLEIDGDCDDTDPSIAPDATEVPANGIDDDCDGAIDDVDRDGDGTADDLDCEPDDENIHPGAEEIPNGVDEDCDGTIDEGTDLFDDDGDGWTEDEGDCNDADADVLPDAEETADGVDEDCDGTVDEGTEAYDDDGDGYTEQGGDCDDADATVNPSAEEVADNGLDDDCDDETDEVDGADDDLDGDGFTVGLGDCADDNELVYPQAYEICDGLDNDCNGTIDDGCGEDGTKGCGCATGAELGGLWSLLLAGGLLLRRRR